MVIRVSDIPPEGLEIHFNPGKDWKPAKQFKQIDLAAPLCSVIKLKKEQNKIRLTGELNAVLWLFCARCLEPFHYPLDITIDYVLIPKHQMPKEEGLRLKNKDMEIEFFNGTELDIDHVINEQIFLNIPIKPLCHRNCVGLCPYCGTNLNKKRCNCKGPSFYPFYEVLKHLKH